MSEAAKRPRRMVEAAGAELYIHVIAKLVMARDFWGERSVEKNLDASPFSSDVRTTSTSTISGREHATEEPAHDRPSTLLGEDDGEADRATKATARCSSSSRTGSAVSGRSSLASSCRRC
jgi:hypothetical protein